MYTGNCMVRPRIFRRIRARRRRVGFWLLAFFGILTAVGLTGWQIVRRAHHHVAKRPHLALIDRWRWYRSWHSQKYHHHTHFGVLAVSVAAIGINSGLFRTVFASDIAQSWDFSVPGQYAVSDSNAVELNGSNARLKAQNYASDANTKALYHFDEASGTDAADDSGNGNNATVTGATFGAGNLNNGLNLDGTTHQATAPDSASLSLTQNNSIEAWTKFSSAFGAGTHDHKQGILDKGSYKLYYDKETGKVTYEIANASANTWTQQAGNDIKGSWDLNGKFAVNSQVAVGTDIYVGLGNAVGDAEVWKWNGTIWSQVGGDAKNSSWADQTYENVMSMALNGTVLYAGLGSSAGDAEVWSCDTAASCTTWSKIGGDAINGSWPVNTAEEVESMTVMAGNLYVGLGLTATTDARVYRWNGSSWTWVGGNGIGVPYNALPAGYEAIYSLTNDGSNIYAGFGNTAGDADIWRLAGTTWSQIGGDGVGSSWAAATYETAISMRWFGNNVYVGLGTTAGDAEVWRCDTTASCTAWTKIGGDTLNSGWDGTNYEGVYSFADDGTNLYAGLGATAGDNEVYRWNGIAWTKIGGDAINSGFTNTHTVVNSLLHTNGNLYAGLVSTANNAEIWAYNGTTWARIGGGYINKSWGGYNIQDVETMTVSGEYLYAGTGNTVAGNAQVWRFDGTSWQIIGGQGINSSWPAATYENVMSLMSYGGQLYAGLGTTANDAEVWRWNGTTWSQIGGDSLNSGWTTNYEEIYAMTLYNGNLIVGLGNTANDAETWAWNGAAWSKFGGDSLNSGWTTNFERVSAMAVYGGQLYAGLGNTAGDAEVWRWNGSVWAKVGGDGLSSSWNTVYEQVEALVTYNGKLYAGLGNSTGDAEVWEYNGSAWSQIGGDGLSSSWLDGQYEQAKSLAVYDGMLYAGLGNSAGDGEVWVYDTTGWSKVGGGGTNSSWVANATETVQSFAIYQGKLFAGLGNSANVDAVIWSYGGNGFLQSNLTSQDTNWHHVAASYDGSTMKLFIDGVLDSQTNVTLSIPDTNLPLLIGATYGGSTSESGTDQGCFTGSLDEIRISNSARTSFTTLPFSNTPQTVTTTAVFPAGVASWDSLTDNQTTNGGSINYRVSTDGGVSWLYWTGAVWGASTSTSQANPIATISTNLITLPVTGSGFQWQAVLSGNGNQRVQLNSVSLDATADSTAPNAPTALAMLKSSGGANVAAGSWTNGYQPYVSWTAGSDSQSAVRGYCAYLGTDNTADPATTKGLLGTTPADTTGTTCPFIASSTDLDFATPALRGNPWLTSSASPYYLRLKTIDNAGNLSATTASFDFKFDNTAPANPAFITTPSQFVSSKTVTFTWPTSGGNAATDADSGLVGLQYRLGASGTWFGDSHTGVQDATDTLTNDGSYTTQDPPDFDDLIEGNNNVYVRTWDVAGNVSTSYVTGVIKLNSSSPSQPQNVTALPATNTTNSFAFNWLPPASFAGDQSNLTYCYTINTTPTLNNCTYTSAGVTSLGANAYATQPGDNTFYVVAKDEAGNINYATFGSVIFSANTAAPGIPLNVEIADISVKATNNWKLALSWEAPADTGSGISSYKIYRSSDNLTFTNIASNNGASYVDTGLSQHVYYYKVKACDSANNCGASTAAVDETPTGRFTTAAELVSDPVITSISTRKATVSWSTDRVSDSKIALGSASGVYSTDEVSNSGQVTSHTITLDNLQSGTTYYYKAKWTDEDGNTGFSSELSFTTLPAPTVKEVSTKSLGLNAATVQFTTNQATKAKIYFGKSEGFGGLQIVNTSTVESTYSVGLSCLEVGTTYYYKINPFDADGNEYEGNIFSLTTPARPQISNLRFQPVAGEPTSTQKITWTTNVATSSLVRYGLAGQTPNEAVDSKMVTLHEITISQLQDNSDYVLTAQSRDAAGNLAISDEQRFKTALDTRPPTVKNLTIETTIRGTGAEARGQVVVSWNTDEPSTSQVEYAEGSSGSTYTNRTSEDLNLVTQHTVIVSDLPTSKVFHLRANSHDRAANSGVSEDRSTIIGRATDSVLSIIFNALRNVFSFLE